jgi:hypothetical protein
MNADNKSSSKIILPYSFFGYGSLIFKIGFKPNVIFENWTPIVNTHVGERLDYILIFQIVSFRIVLKILNINWQVRIEKQIVN